MERPWYDTKEGITNSLGNLKALHGLRDERQRAGYTRRESLSEFVVLGRFVLDTCGNFCRLDDGCVLPQEEGSGIPDARNVLTLAEFQTFWRQRLFDSGEQPAIVWSLDGDFPPMHTLCPECGRGWVIENCHDAVVHDTDATVSLAAFVGQTLGEVLTAFRKRRDAVFISRSFLIRNDRFINDPTPDSQNRNGWVSEAHGIGDDYVVQAGDETLFLRREYFHIACWQGHLSHQLRSEFQDICERAGLELLSVEAVSNEYGSVSYRGPWFRLRTKVGHFVIGWRKRVIQIDWSETGFDGTELFTGEGVTRGAHMIHALGTDKAVEYLGKIRQALTRQAAA